MDNLDNLVKNTSIKEGLDDVQNMDVKASNQIDGNQIKSMAVKG